VLLERVWKKGVDPRQQNVCMAVLRRRSPAKNYTCAKDSVHLRQKLGIPAPGMTGWVANVVGKKYLCDADRLNNNHLQDMNKEFAVSAVVHGIVFALFMAVGSWIWHWGTSWVALVIAGVLYGVMSAALDRLLEKRKKNDGDEK
jgi:hypothetical protein